MVDQDDPQFDAMTARLLQREALRRAAEELNTTSGPGLEEALARISAEVTEEAAHRINPTAAMLIRHRTQSRRGTNDLAWRVRESISSRRSRPARARA
jgi:hypothetical protein